MKVILLQDVPKVGKKYEEREVAAGFARNFLIPRGKAALPREFNEEKLTELRKKAGQEGTQKAEELKLAIDSLAEKKVTIKARASEEGHLFAGLKKTKIAEALAAEYQLAIDPEIIILDQPIKSVGSHMVEIGEGNEIEVVVEPEV